MTTRTTDDDAAAIDRVRTHWDARAPRYTDTANKRVTIQCSRQLYAHMQLETAQHVLEVAAGAGVCSLEALAILANENSNANKSKKTTYTITDLSPVMVDMAKKNLGDAMTKASDRVDVAVVEANGQDLVGFAPASVDRYIASMCLQLCPDPDALLREAKRVLTPDGIAGFTIWARPENSGLFNIDAQVAKETGTGDGSDHANFALGNDLSALRQRFKNAGFSKIMVWPFLCVLELWSGEAFGEFYHDTFFFAVDDDDLRAQRRAAATRLATQWLAEKQFPLGLETYIILARP